MAIQILNGLVYGSLLYVLSVGLVLIFGLRRVVNFAHGGMFMIGGYVGYTVSATAGFGAGVLVSVLAMAVFGVLLDRFVFRQLQDHDPIVTVLVTFGILLVLEDVAKTVWGNEMLSLPMPQALSGVVMLGDTGFPVYRLFVVGVAIVVALGLGLWLRCSRAGLFVRAASVDPVTTGMQGVNTERLSAIVVGVGIGLAGLAGTVSAPLLALAPSIGASIVIDAFIVVVTGGLTSFTGAFIAAMLIGQVHNWGVAFVPAAASLIPLLLMVCVLIWRPQGFGKSAA
ncbi:High-affinity branched-chain amino acid transport system permease protein LivH [Paraburkholderia kirstenboschensis]|uniref:branched-chain amino acid ABC transporter permease n=1 Tax=Paraburkholderia kirstenboschensis TaxID=1245436 RepID=UPI000AA4B1BE|nr:branched-chain amino acid ABC transporter permease [Paraburkholderia kirstenboschensis]CAD6560623.1 High-affinity branched-chain amino acid transport system permease protein LivH [Paraburkholderia kirstenboschensis]